MLRVGLPEAQVPDPEVQIPPEPEAAPPEVSPLQVANSKIPQTNAGYLGPEHGPFTCSNCHFWEDPNSCSVVDGLIDPNGCCNNFTNMDAQSPMLPPEEPIEGASEAGLEPEAPEVPNA